MEGYFQTTQSALKGLAGDLRSSTVNIGFITDNHHQLTSYAPNSLRHYSYIAKLSRLGKLDAIVAGGDNINGYYDRNQILIEMRQVTSTLFNRAAAQTDVFFAMGIMIPELVKMGKINQVQLYQ